jgi:hypothetical protein
MADTEPKTAKQMANAPVANVSCRRFPEGAVEVVEEFINYFRSIAYRYRSKPRLSRKQITLAPSAGPMTAVSPPR